MGRTSRPALPHGLKGSPVVLRTKLTVLLAPAATLLVALSLPALAAAQDVPAPAATTPAPAATTPTATAPAPAPADPPEEDAGIVPKAATKAVSYAARLVVPVVVRKTPSNRGKRVTKLEPYGSWNGGPVVLQIAAVKTVNGTPWLRVRLPIRPNGSTGWIRQTSVEVKELRYRITISRRSHRLTLFKDGRKAGSTQVVIGASKTPTPKGTFAVLEVVQQPKGEVIGPWALHLTAHSNVLDNYGGGPGRVALHGRSGGLLSDPLGSSRSHGCIRMPNTFITMLHSVATEGTPVVIS